MVLGRNMVMGSVPGFVEFRLANQEATVGSKKARRHISTRGNRDSIGSASTRAFVT